MGQSGRRRVMELSAPQVLVLAVVAGAFITAGALFSLLLATGVGAPGPKLLLERARIGGGFRGAVGVGCPSGTASMLGGSGGAA
jgi:hypothetical protein